MNTDTVLSRAILLSLPVFLLAFVFPAWASLGGNTMSVQDDQVHMKGTMRSTPSDRYVLQEITTPSGGTVREYVSGSGTVFGVVWNGPGSPDLQQLLGSHFETVRKAAAQRRGRGPVVIDTPDLYFVQTGHMRAMHGVAYLPQQLPNGVQTTDIK